MTIPETTAYRIVELLQNGARLRLAKSMSPMMGGHNVTYFYEDGLFYSEESWYDLRNQEGHTSRNAIGGTGMLLGRLLRMELNADIQSFLSEYESKGEDGEQRP